ncbi:MAG: AMP-binding protein [Methanoregula sp.]|jgi:acyl-CoA synthetase (AMP-forming)/AMP-acid ligase II|nr:AMP-binding protein [Methanoregula sp.]
MRLTGDSRIGSITTQNHVYTDGMEEADHSTIRDLILNGHQDPDQHAIESPGYLPLTYRDLREQIISVVKSLNARGFHRNDRIAIITPAGPETAVCIVAVMAGFTSVVLNPQQKNREFEEIFSRVGIKAIIVLQGHPTAARAVAASCTLPVMELVPVSGVAGKFNLLPEIFFNDVVPEFASPSDTAYVLLTSGTTAAAKVIPRTQEQSATGKKRTCEYQGITCVDRCLHITPYYHGMGVGAPLISPLIAGATVISPRDFIPSDFFDLLMTFHPTYYTAGPALNHGILRELKKVPADLLKHHSLRYIRSSAGVFPEDLRKDLETLLGIPVIDSYGLSEAGLVAINIPQKPGSVGIPCINTLAILGDNDELLPAGSSGEIAITNDLFFSRYENAPVDNTAAFTDGWFRTGDLGYLDDDGYLFLTGRKKELINKGGQKISPEEIDAVLWSHHGVNDAMAFPVPDAVLGEDIAAMVVPDDGTVTEADLRMYLLERLVQFKVPKRIYLVDAIPKNPAGKPLRHVGSERYGQR